MPSTPGKHQSPACQALRRLSLVQLKPSKPGAIPAVSSASGDRYLDAAILRAAGRRAVRGNRISLTPSLCTEKLRLHASRDHIIHHGMGTLFGQNLVRSNALILQGGTDGSIVGIAVHHQPLLLL